MFIDRIRDRIKAYLKSIDVNILNYNITIIIGNEEYRLDPQPISSSALSLIEDVDQILPAKDLILVELQPSMYYDILLTFNQNAEVDLSFKYKAFGSEQMGVGLVEDIYQPIESHSNVRELSTTFITPPGDDIVLKIECSSSTQPVEEMEQQLLRLAELLKQKTEIKKQILALIYQADSENLEEGVGFE